MEQVASLFHTLIEYGFTPLNVLLIVMLYLVLANQGVVPRFWSKDEQKEQIPDWAKQLHANQDKLAQYANHDTTKHHEMTHDMLGELKDISKESLHVLKELKEYGIKCRIEKE
jgi:hypothetical protein